MATPQNLIPTITMVAPKSAAVLSNETQIAKKVSRDWDDYFAVKGAKIGQPIFIPRPPQYNVRVGNALDVQAETITYSPLTFTTPWGIDLAFTTPELTFSFDHIMQNEMTPAVKKIANYVDQQIHQLAIYVGNATGTPGTPLTGGPSGTSLDAVNQAVSLIYDQDAPVDDFMSEFNPPRFNATLSTNNRGLFNPASEISGIYMRGSMGSYGGANHYIAQAVRTQTYGTVAATGDATVTSSPTNPVYNSTTPAYALTGSLAVTVGTSGHAPNVGDIFTIPGVNAVNPQTKQDLGYAKQFSVVSVSGSGTSWTWTVSPALNSSGPFQNVTALPAPGAAITMFAPAQFVAQQALVIHRDAFMLANKELELPTSAEYADYVVDGETGIGIRYVRSWNPYANQMVDRFDTMVATGTLYEQLASRISYN